MAPITHRAHLCGLTAVVKQQVTDDGVSASKAVILLAKRTQ